MIKRIFFIPDCHVPYHHPLAYACMVEALRSFKPHTLVVLGDFADMYSVSSHIKMRDGMKLAEEAAIAKSALAHLVKTAGKQLERKVYCEGNHEARTLRYLATRAPDLMGITDTKSLLGLEDWEFSPYGHFARVGKLHVTHDVGTAGMNAHRQAMDVFQGSVAIGHTHSAGITYMGNADGPALVGANFGWLGSEEAASEYMHVAKAKRSWVHAFGTGYMTDNGVVYIQCHPILNGQTVLEGQVIQG